MVDMIWCLHQDLFIPVNPATGLSTCALCARPKDFITRAPKAAEYEVLEDGSKRRIPGEIKEPKPHFEHSVFDIRIAEYESGYRCEECDGVRFNGLCPCERDARFTRESKDIALFVMKQSGDPKLSRTVRASQMGALSSAVLRSAKRDTDANGRSFAAETIAAARLATGMGTPKWSPSSNGVADPLPMN